MFEITDPCFAATTTAVRSPKSRGAIAGQGGHRSVQRGIVAGACPERGLMIAAALITTNGARRDVREEGALGNPGGDRGSAHRSRRFASPDCSIPQVDQVGE